MFSPSQGRWVRPIAERSSALVAAGLQTGCASLHLMLEAAGSVLASESRRAMDYRILGPLAVYDEERGAVQLGGRQQRLVFAALLLHRNEVVSVDRLIDVLWGERAPTNAVKNVQVHVSRVRKAL
jgi:DNA-binding response OmpR family regulator